LHKTNKVTVAVRVYDEGGEGGIIHGNVGVWLDKESLLPDIDLQGEWYFKTGNCDNLDDVALNYQSWNKIIVPGTWEDQGYKDYDGIACYALEFELSGQFENDKMILLLGRIDDLDMVYVNGVLVGQSSDFDISTAEQRQDMYKQIRGYYIPDGILNHDGMNLITVRVLDWWGVGGIWDGAIGLITQDNYIDYWRKKRNSVQ
jgi:sialate O-acetylesterase